MGAEENSDELIATVVIPDPLARERERSLLNPNRLAMFPSPNVEAIRIAMARVKTEPRRVLVLIFQVLVLVPDAVAGLVGG